MPDSDLLGNPEPSTEATEETQGVTEAIAPAEPTTDEAPAPWGDDFDPNRAWQTITHLRDRERSLEPDARALERLRAGEDPDTLKEILAAYNLELPDEEPSEEFEDEPDPAALALARVERLENSLAERERLAAAEHTAEAVYAQCAEAGLDDTGTEWVIRYAMADQSGDTFDISGALKAFKDFETHVLNQYRASKKAPAVPSVGTPGTEVPDLNDEKTRHEYMLQRLAGQ